MPTVLEQMRLGWGNPDNPDYYRDHIKVFTAVGVEMRVRAELVPIFKACMLLMDRKYDLDRGVRDDWSYANRDIRGYPGVKSYHSWGLAIDLNALRNVMGSSDFQFNRAYANRVAEACSLTWGGSWQSRPDAMHFEFRGCRASVAAAKRKLKLRHPLVWRKANR
jgi:hypothetical protein